MLLRQARRHTSKSELSSWMRELLAEGLKPEVDTLEETTRYFADLRRSHWEARLLNNGASLLGVRNR